MEHCFYAHRFISLIPFSIMASTATTAPRIEVFTNIICDAYKHSKSPGSDWDSERLGLSVLSMTPYSVTGSSLDPSGVSAAYESLLPVDNSAFRSEGLLPVRGLNDTDWVIHEPLVCSSDPVVQAGVATVLAGTYNNSHSVSPNKIKDILILLNTAMATTTGILSCFTTGWWGSVSYIISKVTLSQSNTSFSCLIVMGAPSSWASLYAVSWFKI